jgi:hypothetical protein
MLVGRLDDLQGPPSTARGAVPDGFGSAAAGRKILPVQCSDRLPNERGLIVVIQNGFINVAANDSPQKLAR